MCFEVVSASFKKIVYYRPGSTSYFLVLCDATLLRHAAVSMEYFGFLVYRAEVQPVYFLSFSDCFLIYYVPSRKCWLWHTHVARYGIPGVNPLHCTGAEGDIRKSFGFSYPDVWDSVWVLVSVCVLQAPARAVHTPTFISRTVIFMWARGRLTSVMEYIQRMDVTPATSVIFACWRLDAWPRAPHNTSIILIPFERVEDALLL